MLNIVLALAEICYCELLVTAGERYHIGFYSRMVLWLLLGSDWMGPSICTVVVYHVCQAVFIDNYKPTDQLCDMVHWLENACSLHFF